MCHHLGAKKRQRLLPQTPLLARLFPRLKAWLSPLWYSWKYLHPKPEQAHIVNDGIKKKKNNLNVGSFGDPTFITWKQNVPFHPPFTQLSNMLTWPLKSLRTPQRRKTPEAGWASHPRNGSNSHFYVMTSYPAGAFPNLCVFWPPWLFRGSHLKRSPELFPINHHMQGGTCHMLGLGQRNHAQRTKQHGSWGGVRGRGC